VSKPLIEIDHVFKEFRLYHRHDATLKAALMSRLQGRVGHYQPFWALRDINVTVNDGEVLGVIGPNGAGKSTLMSVMAGILCPTSGRVTVRGTCAALMGLGVGLDPLLTGRENAFLYGSILGLSRRVMAERMDEIMDFAELGEFADSPIRTYSSGMQARLTFSVAINVTPEILLLDEVMAVGDISFSRKCLDRMMGLREKIRSIVIIAHQMDTIKSWCDKVLWLEHGGVVRQGPTDEIIEAYQEVSTRGQATGIFADIPYSSPARGYIEEVFSRGIMEANSFSLDTGMRLFDADRLIRRRDLARYVCRAAKQNPLTSSRPRFSDVPAIDPDYGWIERLADAASWPGGEAGSPIQILLKGGSEFTPDSPITRAEMAAFLCRCLDKAPLASASPTFIDVQPTHRYYGFIERIADPDSWSAGFPIGGYGYGTKERRFDPEGLTNRLEAAVIISRAWSLLESSAKEMA